VVILNVLGIALPTADILHTNPILPIMAQVANTVRKELHCQYD